MKYKFNPEPAAAAFTVKPAGDYTAIVVECGEPFLKEDTKNWTLKVRLAVGDDHATVFDNPWSRSEESATQDGRDGIAQFLIACNMAPAPGKEPNFLGCVGKKCRLKLKVEKATQGSLVGQDVNRVAFYYAQAKSAPKEATTASTSEFEKARAAQGMKIQGGGGAEPEPDNIPYTCDRG